MLTKTYLEDDLVRRLKGLDGGALAVLTDAADGGERLHSGCSNLHCTACRHLSKADDGGSLGSSPSWWGENAGVRQPVLYHLGCPLVILHSPTWLA